MYSGISSFNPFLLLTVLLALLGTITQYILNKKFEKYRKLPSQLKMSGRVAAETMLKDHGIHDVQVTHIKGSLTDHYNPINKTVNLSDHVYYGTNSVATAIAAHECGHAVQHAQSYGPLKLRSKLVPLIQVSGKVTNTIVLLSAVAGYFIYRVFPLQLVLIVLIICYSLFALFSLITLPVERDASARALKWMKTLPEVNKKDAFYAKDALKWAGRTYVVAALSSITSLLYYIVKLKNSKK